MTLSEKILRWIVLGGIFILPFVPLIVTTSLFFPYITGKNFTFRVVVEIITLAWLALALLNPIYRPRRSWIFAAFLIFIAIIAIADAQGVNPTKSFWSNYERMDGWITIAHLFCYTVVAACVMNAEKLWRRLFDITLAISVFIDLLGFSQILGVISIGQGTAGGLTARIDATFGNPIYLAVYMLFNIFFAVLLIVQDGDQEWSVMEKVGFPLALFLGLLTIAAAGGALSWSAVLLYIIVLAAIIGLSFLKKTYLFALVIFLDTIALLFTGTRGTTLGLVGGAVLAAIIYVFIAQDAKRARPYVIGCIALLVVLSGVLYAARNTGAVKSIGFLDRLATISTHDITIDARIYNIQTAWKGIKERPIFGWGQENYAIVFDKYYDPRMYADEPWFDRVHNIIFDWWIAGGTLGLLAYLGLLVSYLYVLWRSKAFTAAERSILTGLLAGYFIHNLTVFDNVTSYILFGSVLAYIVYRASETDGTPQVALPTLSESMAPAALFGALLLGLLAVWFINGNAFQENQAILAGLSQQPSVDQNLAEFERALSYHTYGDQEAREQLAQITTEIAAASAAQIPTATKAQFLAEAVQELQLQEQVSPLDARNPLFIGTLYDAYGEYALAQPALMQSHDLSPTKQTIIFELALNAQTQGDTTDAFNYFAQAYNLDTDYLEARLYYAAAAITSKNFTLADQLLAPIIPTGQAADPRISAAYASAGQYQPIITIWEAHVKADPTDTQGYFTLAAAYFAAGEKTQAIATLQTLEQIDPSSSSQADALIQEIKSGTAKLQ